MTTQERNQSIRNHFEYIMDIADKKGKEYAVNGGAFTNFESDEEIGVDSIQSIGVFMNKHYRSIRFWIKNRKVLSEPIIGRLYDLILYAFILITKIEDDLCSTSQQKTKSTNSSSKAKKTKPTNSTKRL